MAHMVLYFSASWCRPCAIMRKSVEWLAQKFPGVEFRNHDVEDAAGLADKYRIKSLPTLIHISDGEEICRVEGLKPREDLITCLSLQGLQEEGDSVYKI